MTQETGVQGTASGFREARTGLRRALALDWREFLLVLAVVDAALVLVVLLGTIRLWDALRPDFTPTSFFELWIAGTWLLWLFALRVGGAYDLLSPEDGAGRTGPLIRALVIVAAVTLTAYFLAPRAFPRSTTLIAPLPVFVALLFWHGIAVARVLRWPLLERRVLLLGLDATTERLAAALAAPGRPVPYAAVGILTDRSAAPPSVAGVPVLVGTDRLWEHVRRLDVQEIAIARSEPLPEGSRARLVECFQAGVAAGDAVRLYEELTGRVLVGQIGPSWYAELPTTSRRPYLAAKRAIDAALAASLLVLLSPLLLLIALATLLVDGRPIFYTQTRVGRRGEPFTIHKFRSMRRDAERDGPRWAERRDPRSTRLGRFLRPWGLDELPQLWDVLRGRMSLVGPRPEGPEFSARLAAELPLYVGRLLVRPGMVGWAEVHVPHAGTTDEHLVRLEYDLFYVKRASLLLDIDIALRALGIVLSGRR